MNKRPIHILLDQKKKSGGSVTSTTKPISDEKLLQKLTKKKESLERRLDKAKERSLQTFKNLGWGSGMRKVKLVSYSAETNLKNELDYIEEKINELKVRQSDNFKKWFGDSKIVDENGQPLIVYHGTEKMFNKFNNKYSAQGVFWFTSNKEKIIKGESGASKTNHIIPVYLKANRVAGWKEYNKLGLGQIQRDFDAIKLDDDYIVFEPNQIKIADGSNVTFDSFNKDIRYETGGEINKEETYHKWKRLVNMSSSELKKFYDSKEGKEAGLSASEAKEHGIDSGRESARWIMRMKDTPHSKWTPEMWKWANKQISFISRMSGNKGGLYDDNGNKTRKHTALLIWGHNPEKYAEGGELNSDFVFRKRDKMDSFGYERVVYDILFDEIRVGYIYPTKFFGSKAVFGLKKYGVAKNEEIGFFYGDDKYFDTLDEAKKYAIENYGLYEAGGELKYNYFQKTYNTAKKYFDEYKNKTEAQRSNIAFGAAGNLSKASANRFKTIRDVSSDKYSRYKIRKVMLDIYNAEFYGWADIPNWNVFDQIIMDCNQDRSYTDDYDYYQASFNVPLGKKMEAIEHFINRYGTETDKRILIPKLSRGKMGKKMVNGGGIENSEKSFNFDFKPTKNEIRNIISGTGKVKHGENIHTIASYLRKSKETGRGIKEQQSIKEQEAERIELYSKENGLWFPNLNINERYLTEGAEQKVYLIEDDIVIKLSDAIFYNTWEDYLNNLLLHNYFFPFTSYQLIGFTKIENNLFTIVKQHFIEKTEETNLESVQKFLKDNGFIKTKNNDYYNSELGVIIEDLHEENVLTRDGVLYFIDTVFYFSEKTYKQLESGGQLNETFQEKFQKEVTAAQRLNDRLSGKLKINSDGSVTVYHGTSEAAKKNILESRHLEHDSYFSKSPTGIKYGDSPIAVAKRKFGEQGTVMELKVYASNLEPAAGGSELYCPVDLYKNEQGIWDAKENLKTGGDMKIDETLILEKPKTVKGISRRYGVSVDYVLAQIKKGIDIERKRTSDINEAKIIVINNVSEQPDYYDNWEEKQKVLNPAEAYQEEVKPQPSEYIKFTKKEMSGGGALVGKDGGKKVVHNDGNKGGIIDGERHSNGGVGAVNTDTGQPLEVEGEEAQIVPEAANKKEVHEFEGKKLTNKEVLSEINQSGGGVPIAATGGTVKQVQTMEKGGELQLPANSVIITRNAVLDKSKREFDGEMLTNREILSRINQSGGGISFETGGEIPEECSYCDSEHTYNGKKLKDSEIIKDITDGYTKRNNGIDYPHLQPSEAFEIITTEEFIEIPESEKDFYEAGGMIRLVNKKVPSLRTYIQAKGIKNPSMAKYKYQIFLQKEYGVNFAYLPEIVKIGLLTDNQTLVDSYVNQE